MDRNKLHPLYLAAGAAALVFGLIGAAAIASAPSDTEAAGARDGAARSHADAAPRAERRT